MRFHVSVVSIRVLTDQFCPGLMAFSGKWSPMCHAIPCRKFGRRLALLSIHNRVKLPFAGHAFERVYSSVHEGEVGAGNKILHRL